MNDLSLLAAPDLPRALTLASVPDGLEALILGDLARAAGGPLVFVARDGERMRLVGEGLAFFAPDIAQVRLPAWDCMPYDRVSPSAAVQARRMAALAALARDAQSGPRVLLTTANAVVQRMPPRALMAKASRSLAVGAQIDMQSIVDWLEDNAFLRTPTVRTAGEYAVRGGIVDLYAPGAPAPVRLDFFGDTLESIRPFDPDSQRTTGQQTTLDLVPMSELTLTPATIRRFRENYVRAFGAPSRDDLLYHAVSEGVRHPGIEHWMPLFFESLDTLFDYAPGARFVVDHLAEDAIRQRLAEVDDHFEARRAALGVKDAGVPYLPLPPERLYLTGEDWPARLAEQPRIALSPFAHPDKPDVHTISADGRTGRGFAAERAAGDVNVFDAAVAHMRALATAGETVIVAAWTEGSRDRLAQVLADHGLSGARPVADWNEARALPKGAAALAVLELEHGFETPHLAVVAEQDILGDRLVSGRRRRRTGADVLREASSLAEGDIVVHADHGIGRFAGLRTIEAAGAPHDCVELVYHNDDKLYLPVENIDLLSRYGSDAAEVTLDKLGGVAWQARKARMKQRIRELADQLIRTAAARMMKSAPVIEPPDGLFDEFAARFPYEETDDQLGAIDAVVEDLARARPMDRLVCGDVGFGKTEVALRAAFLAVMEGKQVAVIVPTTLLARQHFKTFTERFAGLPVRVEQASRLVPAKQLAVVKAGLEDGSVDIVIGTHALLSKTVAFRDLGLLVVDEEQHFGVKHKERLKELKADVHVLTMTATPIPRTLQLALTGVRELSIIATPPIDRLAVRTFIAPFDALTVREALLRERYRGGQSFYVCPRISDLSEQKAFLDAHVPELKVAVAHGRMPARELDEVMNGFYDGRYDVLLCTTIVESGLDIPTANTLVVHRADMFGLAQLYQLRGRIGRSKVRAYALLTVPPEQTPTPAAMRRLEVLQSLDTLGAGFQLASHDLDIRGAGNLLGEEQSGHIREVGYELYQQMLEEAVASLRSGEEAETPEHWSPQIALGASVMIPEVYVPDLQLRMSLYRRLADLSEPRDIDAFAAELVDRFGPIPEEVEALLKVVWIKGLCRRANVEKVDAGPKGVVLSFRENTFPNPPALVRWISEQGTLAKLRPDHKLVIARDWPKVDDRMKGTAAVLARLADVGERVAA